MTAPGIDPVHSWLTWWRPAALAASWRDAIEQGSGSLTGALFHSGGVMEDMRGR